MAWVLKRDGQPEPFDRRKLGGCLLRALRADPKDARLAEALCRAIEFYLAHRHLRCVSSAALLEMALTALRAAGLAQAAECLESHHAARVRLRSRLTLHHRPGLKTSWSKHWLAAQAASQWKLGRTTARFLAGQVEDELAAHSAREVTRRAVLERLAELAAEWGLTTPAYSPSGGTARGA